MTIFKKIISSLQRSRQREALYYLENMSERQLVDCGFSPDLVAKGLVGWPWRIDSITQTSTLSQNTEQQHVNELNQYTDIELADLGIRRGTIVDSVRNGRPGIERLVTDKAA